MEKSDQRYSGVVKFFNCNKGYGFILPNGVEGIKDNEEGKNAFLIIQFASTNVQFSSFLPNF